MNLFLRVFTCCFRGLKRLKPFFVFVPRLLFALSSCAGRGNVCVFRDAGVATAHCCGIGVLLTWLVSSEGLVARFVPDGLTLRAAGSWKNSLAVVVVSTSKRSTGTGAGGAAFHAPQQRDHQQRTLAYARLVISRNVLQGFPAARYADSSRTNPRPTTVEWCREVAPYLVLTV